MLVLNDALGGLLESATYCKENDEKRPGLVGLPDFTTQQICPETLSQGAAQVTNAAPQAWYIRVMFDELLDTSVEDLTEILEDGQPSGVYTGSIAKTKPVTLRCQDFQGALVDVPYDGYYSPSGNNVTWPLGPSLVVKPNAPATISVGSECEITLGENIRDKAGEAVPSAQRGPFKFRLAPVEVIATSPADGEEIDPEAGGVEFIFNTDLDPASLCLNGAAPTPFSPNACTSLIPEETDSKIRFTPVATNTGVQTIALNDHFVFGDILDSTEYTVEIPTGTELRDACGKASILPAPAVGLNTRLAFKTTPIELFTVSPFGGENLAPGRKIRVDFNQLMDPTSLDATEYTITPAPEGLSLRGDFNGDTSIVLVNGQYQLNTEYTFTLKAGAKIGDAFGTKEYTVAEDIVAKFRTAPAIALTASSPTSGATVTKATPASAVTVRLTFNQEMDPSSFTSGTDFTLVDDATGQVIPVAVTQEPTNRSQLRFRSSTPMGGALAPGNYTFTFKAGAQVQDRLTTPNVFTQASDRVIKFTVAEAGESPECLGVL